MAKVSEFLNDLNSHGIYANAALADDFRKSTGMEPCWPVHSAQATAQAIAARGLGGEVNGNGEVAWGYEVAGALADKYGSQEFTQFSGRGSQFREALRRLIATGN